MNALLLFLLLTALVPGKAATREVSLPCELPELAAAADGSGLWLACPRNWAAIKQAQAAAQPPPAANQRPSDVYWIDATEGTPKRIATSDEAVDLVAAPSGLQPLMVLVQRSGSPRATLYNGKERIQELPVDPSFLIWSGDSQKLYFYGGTTTQADGWNILGIYELKDGTIAREKLREPTEIIRICPATGEVYSVIPQYPNFQGSTIEYTPSLQFVRRIHSWVGAEFSARCTYVASEFDYHGPLPWSIYDTSTGKQLFQFSAAVDQSNGDIYRLVAWNPKYDSVLLREGLSGKQERVFEVFDVRNGRVLQTLPGGGAALWSADGSNIIVAHGNVLTWYPARF